MPTKDDVLPFIQEINNAIQQNSINQVSAAFYKLGKYLQEQYPGKNSEDIQKALGKNGINFSSFELPNLEMVTFLLRARENLADEGVENEERRNYLAAHLIGINCYLKVMDEPVLDAAQVSRTNKIFDIIGQAIRIFPQVAEENTRLAREVLLDFEKVKNTPEDFQKAGPQLISLRNLELTDQVQDIKKVHLQEIGKRRIPPQLLAQEPKNIDKIQTIMLLLSQLKEISWSVIKDKVDPLEEKQAREDNKKIAKLADDIEKHLIEYYSGKQGLEEKIALSEGMNHLLEENNNLIEKFDKNFIASLKKITLQPNELSKIKDLVEAFKTLAVEVQKIDEHNPDRKKTLYFIEEGKSNLIPIIQETDLLRIRLLWKLIFEE
ncbi:hypothetical protein [Legionella cincinnatiensis]|uniref:Uncharacterized protein n=1 Tax=Legionella cincinnatiensis TaxID=28085 RepID=A0A378IK96_9GAMM|nr:hypothetical protein [Legionella cincinnatiensis]KTC83181.1 hypothetical protein Lcin_2553 [Legionella cincinnatiensis]STX35687.1 Uncharacterised protein [Legionella cincinnatiensis]